MATSTNVTPVAGAVPGSNAVVNEVGDLWELTLVGQMSGNVATASTWNYRQATSFSADQNPAQDLVNAFVEGVGTPLPVITSLQSDTFAFVCALARNLSQPKSFTNTFTIQDGAGGIVGGEINSSNTVQRIIIMDAAGQTRARKSIYLPGIDQQWISDSKLSAAGRGLLVAAIDAMYTLTGAIGLWSWQYTSDPEDPDRPAANAFPACFISRLKSRTPALC